MDLATLQARLELGELLAELLELARLDVHICGQPLHVRLELSQMRGRRWG